MPVQIATASIVEVDDSTLEVSNTYPGTYGFYVRLSRDPGSEWAAELFAAYEAARHPIKPPVLFRGDTLCVYFLPLYQEHLEDYLRFLESVVEETNRAVEQRNRALPDDSTARESFRARLREAARILQNER